MELFFKNTILDRTLNLKLPTHSDAGQSGEATLHPARGTGVALPYAKVRYVV